MNKRENEPLESRMLTIDEVRLVSDLRIMHAKVDELFHIITTLQERYSQTDIYEYSDSRILGGDINKVDEIYLWFVKIKEERERQRAKTNG
ncbi:MAG: hypothetical protein ACR2IF_00345 [Terriglobales bacterium]